jgi:glutamate racemase
LVEQVEAGELDSAATRVLIERYTQPLIARGADTLVLGCTHYPFLKPLITAAVGPAVTLIDTGEAVARQVVRRLPATALAVQAEAPTERFWSTGDVVSARRIMSQLWRRAVTVDAV